MGVRLLYGRYDGCEAAACMIDSVTGLAFGPLFEDVHEAEAFLSWMANDGCDPRASEDIAADVLTFREERRCVAVDGKTRCDERGTVQVDGQRFCRTHARIAKRWRDRRDDGGGDLGAGLTMSLAVERAGGER